MLVSDLGGLDLDLGGRDLGGRDLGGRYKFLTLLHKNGPIG